MQATCHRRNHLAGRQGIVLSELGFQVRFRNFAPVFGQWCWPPVNKALVAHMFHCGLGQSACCSYCSVNGTSVPLPVQNFLAISGNARQICDFQSWHPFCNSPHCRRKARSKNRTYEKSYCYFSHPRAAHHERSSWARQFGLRSIRRSGSRNGATSVPVRCGG